MSTSRQHWMVSVQDSINNYRIVQTGYYDGTEAGARRYFTTKRCEQVQKFFGNMRYQITMTTNPVVLQEPD